MKNVLSIDLESWVHRDKIENEQVRKVLDDGFIIKSTNMLLDLLEKYKVKTTFFVVGEIFDWYPEIVNEIKKMGHELAYHPHTHRLLITKGQLLNELKKSSDFLNKFNPKGFRAVQIFLRRDYLQVLFRHGFRYDSSIYSPFELCRKVDGILEVPVSTYGLCGGRPSLYFPRNLISSIIDGEFPFGSGFSIGLLGSKISSFIRRVNDEHKPAVLFIHPWQLCSTPKRLQLRSVGMLPYYVNRYRAIETLLANYEFYTMSELVEEIDDG